MHYYIYNGTETIQAEEATYQEWEFSDKQKYSFKDYSLAAADSLHTIQVGYEGVIAYEEEAKPFVLGYTWKTKISGKEESRTKLEFYDTYENVGQRRLQLIKKIKKSLKSSLN